MSFAFRNSASHFYHLFLYPEGESEDFEEEEEDDEEDVVAEEDDDEDESGDDDVSLFAGAV